MILPTESPPLPADRRPAELPVSPFLLGAFAPVNRESTVDRLTVRGRLPEALDGLFTQIGPNPVRAPRHTDVDRYQWFRQDGMVSGIRLRGGHAEWFRNRWVRSTNVTRTLGEPRTPGRRNFPIGTVHTNVVAHGGMLLALVETGCTPVRLDSELRTLAYDDLDGALPRGASAHPRIDPNTGELHAVVYSPLHTWAEYTVLTPAGVLRSRRRFPLGGRPMLHDIALTDKHVVFFDLPVRFRLPAAVRGRFPYAWDDRHQARIGVLPRNGTAEVRWFDIPPCFVFHTVTAAENDGRIELRAIRYPRLFDTGSADPLTRGGQLWQWVVDLNIGTVTERQLDDRAQELPRVDPHTITRGARYHYAVTADSTGNVAGHVPESLLRHDVRTGVTELRRCRPGTVPSEAVFVPDPASHPADPDGARHGWVLYFCFDEREGTSELVVVDSGDFGGAPVAVVSLPVKVPFGFHSSWISGSELPS